MALRQDWTELIHRLSARAASVKNELLTAHALYSFVLVLHLIALELLLAAVSLPLYFVVRDIERRGTQGKRQFAVRRVITLSVLIAILIIWSLKLAFIVFAPLFTNVSRPFRVSSLHERPAAEFLLPRAITAPVDPRLPAPPIEVIGQTPWGGISVSGRSPPEATVSLFISEANPKIKAEYVRVYTVQSDADGRWNAANDRRVYVFPVGDYLLSASYYDELSDVKSGLGAQLPFKVRKDWPELLAERLDITVNIISMLFVSVGIFLTLLII